MAVLNAAGGDRTASITGTAIETTAAFSPDLHGTESAVEAAEGEQPVCSVEFALHHNVLLFLRIAATGF